MTMCPPYTHLNAVRSRTPASPPRRVISCVGKRFNNGNAQPVPAKPLRTCDRIKVNKTSQKTDVSRHIWNTLRRAKDRRGVGQQATNIREVESRRVWLQPLVSIMLLGEQPLMQGSKFSIDASQAEQMLASEAKLRDVDISGARGKADQLLRSLSQLHRSSSQKYQALITQWLKVEASSSKNMYGAPKTFVESSAPPASRSASPMKRRDKPNGRPRSRQNKKLSSASPALSAAASVRSRSQTHSPWSTKKMQSAKELSRRAAGPNNPTTVVVKSLAGNVKENNTFPKMGWIYPCVLCFRPTSCTLRQPVGGVATTVDQVIKVAEMYICRTCQRAKAASGEIAKLQGVLEMRSNIRVIARS